MRKVSENIRSKIPVAGPSVTQKEIDYVTDAVKTNWYDNANDYVGRFEKAFAKYHEREYAISLPSCTSGLHLSLLALGVAEGDEVIVPDATWIASAAPISYVGATPVFADIDPKTWCISAESIQKLMTPKTKAIIAVNLYGHMPYYDELSKFGIPIIEDAAESIGSKYKNQKSGSFGISSCFSFHGSKTMVTGEGGMLLTDDKAFYNQCMILRDHGRIPGDLLFQNKKVGYKYKMSSMQAAIGLAQLERIDELVEKKREIFEWYKEAFKGVKGIVLNPEDESTYNSYWMSTLLYDHNIYDIEKFELVRKMWEEGIGARPFFAPLSSLEAYSHLDVHNCKKRNIESYKTSAYGVNIPSALCVTKEESLYVRDCIMQILIG